MFPSATAAQPVRHRSRRNSALVLSIQPPLLTSRTAPLFPPPTVFLPTPPTSPFSPRSNNLLAVASAIPASSTSGEPGTPVSGSDDTEDVLTGILAVSGTPLKDGTGIALVFRSLCIKVVGEWRIKIAVLNMEGRQEVEGGETEGAALVGEVLSTVVRVQEGEVDSQAQLAPEEQRFLDSLSA